MATIKFFTRTITKDKNALVPIYVRLKSGRKIDITCKTDILTKPDNWSNETEQARQRADTFRFKAAETEKTGRQEFNNKIAGLRAAIESELELVHLSDLISKLKDKDPAKKRDKDRNKDLSKWLETVIDTHWHPDKYKITLFSFIQTFIDKSETKPNPKTGRPVCYKMRREYEVTFNYLKDYATEKKTVIDFKNIDLDFYDSFTQFLQKKKLAVNTIGKKIKTLKTFLNSARDENKNSYEGYKSKRFKALSEEAETIALNETELNNLYEHDFAGNPGLDRVRDLFLIGCWTGCRFSDIAQITPENISDGLIKLKQYKTDTEVIIPLHPVVTAIFNKYGGRLPEAISNQKFNESLKTVARLAGIDEKTFRAITRGGVKVSTAYKKWQLVTAHTGRRSFATNLYNSGFPSISIMAITGHKTEKSFLLYIKVTPVEHAKKLQEHWGNKHLKVV